ncbi:MAG: low affinity iron permease family protein [Pseudomonas sp.]|uniref:low affinity iron permease family protein n=1 Tax=Pseudomonas sp. TaxID=306 RepID=UPI0012053679|nr:low affinity iron permease family protein [Pseudomonas sp.]RZI76981.1 MAG: low affinity iron permease family protein [Pseudomonas sp.]
MNQLFTRFSSVMSFAAGQPLAFILAVVVVIVWSVTGPLFSYSETWQLIINTGTTIVTFLMVFLIQNGQNRDSAAMQAKLDELVRAVRSAREEFIGIEHLAEKEITKIRDELEKQVGARVDKQRTADETVDQLLRRQ